MSGGFRADLWALRKVASAHLPAIEGEWAAMCTQLVPQTSYLGAYATLADQSMELIIQGFADDLTERLRFGTTAVHETALALRDIADLYARADGQM